MSYVPGRQYFAIPGPSVVPERVLNAMHRPAPDIYAKDFQDVLPGLFADLKRVAGTTGHVAIYVSNGHGAWEAAISNTLSFGDRVLVLSTGMFAQSWGDAARAMGVDVEVMDFGLRSAIDPERVHERLKADKDRVIKAIMAVQVDTSTSVRNDIAALSRVRQDLQHPALLMIDCIASLACDEFRMDAWDVDVVVAGSQKGLMTPPGLGILFFNDRARATGADLCTPYWNWNTRIDPDEFYKYFCGTAPTHHLFGLREALDILLLEEGLDETFRRHERLATAVWHACDAWASGGHLELNVPKPAERSHATTTIRISMANGQRLREWTAGKAGLVLGIGLGMERTIIDATETFRLAHMGHVNAHMTLGALSAIETGLIAIKVPHGKGAIEQAAKILAIA